MSSYQHSNTFGSLKRIEEGISHNLTSFQYLSSLDALLWNAVSLIYCAAPDYVLNYAAKVVAQQTLKPATKFSRNERGSLPQLMFNLAVTKDPQHLSDLHLNRGLLFGMVSHFLKTVNTYREVHDMKIPSTPSSAAAIEYYARLDSGTLPVYNLYAIAREVEYWFEKAQWFKSLIVQKFVRLALMQAQSVYRELEHSLALDDVVQIHLMYVSKAIDRCDSRQGVLTTFIQSWLKSAKAEAAQVAKESYHCSYEDRLESAPETDSVLPDVSYEELQHLSVVAKKVDKEGYVRVALGIPEFVSCKHRAVLLKFVPN